jgi:hypothetical protein
VAALAVALAFPDRFGDYLPSFMQPLVQGPQLVLQDMAILLRSGE